MLTTLKYCVAGVRRMDTDFDYPNVRRASNLHAPLTVWRRHMPISNKDETVDEALTTPATGQLIQPYVAGRNK